MDGEDAVLYGGHILVLEEDHLEGENGIMQILDISRSYNESSNLVRMLDDSASIGSEEVLDGVAGLRRRNLRGAPGAGIHSEVVNG